MSSHLEIWKPSGRELITLSGQRVIVGQASTNPCRSSTTRPSRACMPYWKTSGLLGRYGMWVVAMAPISQREKISAERVLRSGDELRVGKSRLIFWEVKQADEESVNEATIAAESTRPRRA